VSADETEREREREIERERERERQRERQSCLRAQQLRYPNQACSRGLQSITTDRQIRVVKHRDRRKQHMQK